MKNYKIKRKQLKEEVKEAVQQTLKKPKAKRPDIKRDKYKQLTPNYYRILQQESNLAFLSALVHPYETALERRAVAIPATIPVPTTSQHMIYKGSFAVPASGNFELLWVCPKSNIFKTSDPSTNDTTIVYLKSTTADTCTSIVTRPNFKTNKARLVSSELRVRYLGKAIDQSGYVHSAVQFRTIKTWCQIGSGVIDPLIYAAFTPSSTLSAAPWYSKQVLTPGAIHSCIWAPMDYNDMNYYEDASSGALYPQVETHDMNWNVNGVGLTAGTTIEVEVAMNWEVQMKATDDVYPRKTVKPDIPLEKVGQIVESMANRSTQNVELKNALSLLSDPNSFTHKALTGNGGSKFSDALFNIASTVGGTYLDSVIPGLGTVATNVLGGKASVLKGLF